MKILAISFNLIALLLFGIMFEEVNIEHIVPENVEMGNEFVVTVSLEKNGVEGYAKYQAEFPEGVIAKVVDKGSAKFKFEDNKVKFIWMNLPTEEKFEVSYRVIVNKSDITEVPVAGTFSYLSDNQRMTIDVLRKNVFMGPLTQPSTPAANAMVAINRNVTSLGDNQYKVELNIQSSDVSGFAKIQDIIPSGATVSSLSNNDAVFSVVNTKVKFVWMTFPTENGNFTVAYKLDLNNASSQNANDLMGEFAYIEGDESKKIAITSGGSPVAATTQKPKTTSTNTSATVAVATKPAAKKTSKPKKVTSTPAPETGVSYKVQIMAAHKSVNVGSYFSKNYRFNDGVQIDLHEGWNKYLTGGFGTYVDARNKRNNIRNNYKFDGPFVVAYNNGERITVQEALMITHQQWVN